MKTEKRTARRLAAPADQECEKGIMNAADRPDACDSPLFDGNPQLEIFAEEWREKLRKVAARTAQ